MSTTTEQRSAWAWLLTVLLTVDRCCEQFQQMPLEPARDTHDIFWGICALPHSPAAIFFLHVQSYPFLALWLTARGVFPRQIPAGADRRRQPYHHPGRARQGGNEAGWINLDPQPDRACSPRAPSTDCLQP